MLSMAQASRAFWEISCEFLYEAVVLRSESAAKALAYGLAERMEESVIGIGARTKQLMVSPRIDDTNPNPLESFLSAVLLVVQHCPNLRAFVLTSDPAWTNNPMCTIMWKNGIGDLVGASPRGLFYLDIDGWVSPSSSAMKGSADRGESLRALRITSPFCRPDSSSFSFPSLERLCVGSNPSGFYSVDARFICNWRMDSLTHLYIDRIDEVDCDAFWVAKKPMILLLHIGWRSKPSHALCTKILEGVPNLRTLEYSYLCDRHNWQWNDGAVPKPLSHVFVRIFRLDEHGNPLGVLHWDDFDTKSLERILLGAHSNVAPLLLGPIRALSTKLTFVLGRSRLSIPRSSIPHTIVAAGVEICELDYA